MSDNTLPNGSAGEAGAVPEGQPRIHDEASALEALRGILSAEDSGGDAAGQPGSEEAPTPGDEGGEEPPEEAPEAEAPPALVEPPSSWSEQEKTKFRTLPPDVQGIISRRESERDRDYLQKTQEVAARNREILEEKDTYNRSLHQLLALTVPELEQFNQIDWQRLATENPADYVRLDEQRKALRRRVDAIQGEAQRLEQQTLAEQARMRAEVIARERETLIQHIPEFADPQKAQKLTADLTAHLASYGYRPEEVAAAIDSRAIRVARDAMAWRHHVATRQAAEARRAAPPAPTLQQPGTPPQANNAERVRQQKMTRLRESGSVRDAAAIIRDLL